VKIERIPKTKCTAGRTILGTLGNMMTGYVVPIKLDECHKTTQSESGKLIEN
jgi:hypothetical protein